MAKGAVLPTSLLEAKLTTSLRTPSGLKAATLAAIGYLRNKERECEQLAASIPQDGNPNRKVVEVPIDEVRIGFLLEILQAVVDDDTIIQMPVKETMDS